MAFCRENAPIGQTVSLRAIFRDPAGNAVDPDPGTLALYLYDEETDASELDDAIEASDYTGADEVIAPGSITQISTGFYEYEWAVPIATDTGTWYDMWVCDIQGVETATYFRITVTDTGEIEAQSIGENTLIIVLLASTIAGTSGDTLEEETQLSFSTTYSPYYASTDLVRLECGSWIAGIPGDTLALMIHWSSLSADAYTPSHCSGLDPHFQTARTRFVIFDAVLRALVLPASLGGKKKALGDLMIENDSTFTEVIGELKEERAMWAKVLNSCGQLVPGQSFEPVSGAKGLYNPDRRKIGRLWAGSDEWTNRIPATNAKTVMSSRHRRYKHVYAEGY